MRKLRRDGTDYPRHRRRLIARTLASGAAASVVSAAAALVCSHFENGHAARPMNAITHILDGGEPPAHDGERRRNTALGFAIHTAASVWWAVFFEAALERLGRPGMTQAAMTGAGVAAVAYVVDYGVVGPRFQPGFERYLTGRSMFAVYATLAIGFAAGAFLTRKLRTSYGTRSRPMPPRAARRPAARRTAAEPA